MRVSLAAGSGESLLALARELFPIRRSLTGAGVRTTLQHLCRILPELEIHEIASGTEVFDWEVPKEWVLRNAYIEDPVGRTVVSLDDHGLHVVGYSTPVDSLIPLEELQQHLHSIPDQPGAIPYVTSYYEEYWGFCLPHHQREALKPGIYHVVIDSEFVQGSLSYADLVLTGKSSQEVLISTNICHPMMANNELSGPVVATAIAAWISTFEHNLTYRFVFIPETIGSLVYLHNYLGHLQSHVKAGYVLSCIGDERQFSYLPTRSGSTLTDRVGIAAAKDLDPNFKLYSFLDRGSDERQYCSPLANLPIGSLMRSKYGDFPEYHTSLDDFSLVTSDGLAGGFQLVKRAVELLEANFIYKARHVGEPQLGKRNLYNSRSEKKNYLKRNPLRDFLMYADGENDLLTIAEKIEVSPFECASIGETLFQNSLVERWM